MRDLQILLISLLKEDTCAIRNNIFYGEGFCIKKEMLKIQAIFFTFSSLNIIIRVHFYSVILKFLGIFYVISSNLEIQYRRSLLTKFQTLSFL